MSGDDFDPLATARDLLRTSLVGSLATLDEAGGPFPSLVEVASDDDGAPVMLLSRLALHTRNLERDARAALLLDRREGAGPALVRPRISLRGRAVRMDGGAAAPRYLAHHPAAGQYAGFADFAFWRLEVTACHLVAGFGRITGVEPADLLAPRIAALSAAQAGIIAHMNEDHRDAMSLYARHYAGLEGQDWRCAGADTTGMTLIGTAGVCHIRFPVPVDSPAALRAILKEMADRARDRSR
ncbi:MAG: HugZ family protein [Flavobacteriaceae bacterium]